MKINPNVETLLYSESSSDIFSYSRGTATDIMERKTLLLMDETKISIEFTLPSIVRWVSHNSSEYLMHWVNFSFVVLLALLWIAGIPVFKHLMNTV